MSRPRILAALGALTLAILGTIGMVAYVSGAEERAAAGEVLAEVYVVRNRIPAGTLATDFGGRVELDTVPQKLVTNDTIGDIVDLEGLVNEVTLVPGDVLTLARFVDPQTFERQSERVIDRPEGLEEITISLTPERAGGGQVVPGDTVGMVISFDPFEIESQVPIEVDGTIVPPGGSTGNTSFQALHKLLVTNVQLEQVPEVAQREGLGDEEDREVRLVPSGNLLVTFAVDVATAERIVFAAEFGRIWLTNEPADTLESPSTIQTRATIYEDVEDEEDAEITDEESP